MNSVNEKGTDEVDTRSQSATVSSNLEGGNKTSREQPMSPGISQFFRHPLRTIEAVIDNSRSDRWTIASVDQLQVSEEALVIKKPDGTDAGKFTLADVANFYFEPLLSDRDRVDMFVWKKTSILGKLDRVYVGTMSPDLVTTVQSFQKLHHFGL